MAHTLPPVQCAANTFTFEDTTLTAGAVKVRNDHIEELRAQVAVELTRRGLSAAPSYTDSTLTAGAIKLRNDHLTELRTQIEQIQSGRGESGYCPEDIIGVPSWTDTPTSGAVKWRNDHVQEMRDTLNSLKSGCICETEQCEYCADCGYYYTSCNNPGCNCDDHKYSECSYSLNHHYNCGSVNLPDETEHPYKTHPGAVAWDGTVPWDWCSYAPPGSNWTGVNADDWNCKCNPFTW